ncbi:MAG: hypothetical protein KBC96_01890 [Armatimonadetes bacterium]|nr:hypothetical protein [Armatimonadota bacterium]
MKKQVSVALSISAIVAILVSSSAAAAAPSLLGYSGLVTIPTTDSLEKGQYSAAMFVVDLESGPDSNVYALNLGVSDGTEVGFARIRPDGGVGETILNAKHAFRAETQAHPAVATGIIDLTGEIDTTAYVVMSKAISWKNTTKHGEITAPRVHIGAGGGMIDGIFGGLSAVLGERLVLMAEYDSTDFNFGARLLITDELKVHGAILDGDDLALGVSFAKGF